LILLNFAQQVVAAVADRGVAKFTRVSHPDIERPAMPIERRVDDLIAVGRHALGPHSGPMALQHWSRKVFDYMTAVHGRLTFTPEISKIALAKAKKRRRKNDGN
jgi:hypothetical protein